MCQQFPGACHHKGTQERKKTPLHQGAASFKALLANSLNRRVCDLLRLILVILLQRMAEGP